MCKQYSGLIVTRIRSSSRASGESVAAAARGRRFPRRRPRQAIYRPQQARVDDYVLDVVPRPHARVRVRQVHKPVTCLRPAHPPPHAPI
eukprot:6184399-Pyramimonas_sp.AAC.1